MDDLETPDATQQLATLVSQLHAQLLYGCGYAGCKELACDTGRRNISNGKPVRKYTPRAARIIAIAFAGCPNAETHVCDYYDTTTEHPVDVQDGPRDSSSLVQLLSDTPAAIELCYAKPPANHAWMSELAQLHQALASLFVLPDAQRPGSPFLSNEEASLLIRGHLQWIFGKLPASLPRLKWIKINSIITCGSEYPDGRDMHMSNELFSALHVIRDERLLNLLDHILLAIGFRMELERRVELAGKTLSGSSAVSTHNSELGGICHLISKEAGSIHEIMALDVWFKVAFLKHWHGSPDLGRDSVAFAALSMLEVWYQSKGIPVPYRDDMIPLAMRLDAIELAQSWIACAPVANNGACGLSSTFHILTFQRFFTEGHRSTYFRAVCHFRMQQAHSAAEKAATLRRKAHPKAGMKPPEGQVGYNEEPYMLLNVSRGNVLQDTFDQLWQRRTGGLMRPLRVRLGEVDDLEVGHDLGGVQIEYFNLVCSEMFAEGAHLFATDSESGLSYFRAASLQPLYMFELVGLLFALAMHNGITLPISLPLVFYRILLEVDGRISSDTFSPLDLKDGWRATYRSLQAIKNTQAADLEGLEHTLPLEANGLRIAARGISQASATTCTMYIYNATLIDGGGLPNLSEIESAWPGWRIVHTDEEPLPINDADACASDLTTWLVHDSVLPQWTAFRSGFHKVIDVHTLSLFILQATLQRHIEGSTTLNLDDLRMTARYEGFEPTSKYMHSFWRIIGSWPEEKQKRLVKFVTAAERIPAAGVQDLAFVIKRVVPGSMDYLPTSSTCFGTLMLPKYENAKVLEEKLSLAIEFGGEGFGTG